MKILVVDDETAICMLLNEYLSFKGYEVTTVESGEEALAQYNRSKPDMVLLDIKMPGIDGLEVLSRIRKKDPDTGIIMMSAFADEATVQKALRTGADKYLEKPLDLGQIDDTLMRFANKSV
ncbi:MAG: response regulator [Thermodesulfobacteriota bacterium]|nr:response regulator [Thermodesulfobacteriota bacterium]